MFVASSASFCTFRSSRVSSLQGGKWGKESAGFGHWNAAWGSSPKASKGHVSFFSDSSQKLLGIKTLPPTARVLARWSSYKQMPDAIETVKWNQSISSHLKKMIWLVTRNGHDDVHERFKWHHLVLTLPFSSPKASWRFFPYQVRFTFLILSPFPCQTLELLWIWDHHFECPKVPSQRIAATLAEGPSTATVRTPSLDADGLSQTTEGTLLLCHFPNFTLEWHTVWYNMITTNDKLTAKKYIYLLQLLSVILI